MPTGTLHVNTDIDIDQASEDQNNCSLIFQWRSKAHSLVAPHWLLLQPQQDFVSSLPIYIDFLPALEFLRPSSPDAGEEHDFFVVPKTCNVCGYSPYNIHKWRKSKCMTELHAFNKEMSYKHRKCYNIMKYLSEVRLSDKLPNYHLKTIVLQHDIACSDTTDNCVDCIMKMFYDLLLAYKTNKLLSYKSNLNILGTNYRIHDEIAICGRDINALCSVSNTDTWETFIRRLWKQ